MEVYFGKENICTLDSKGELLVTKNSTAFEITYTILWYVGMLNGLTSLDFLGLTKTAVSAHIPIMFFAVGIVILIASIIIKNNRINTSQN